MNNHYYKEAYYKSRFYRFESISTIFSIFKQEETKAGSLMINTLRK